MLSSVNISKFACRLKFFVVFLILVTLPVLLLSQRYALADSTSLAPIRDTYANLAYPDKNYGSLNHLIISNKNTDRLVYLQFEPLDLPEKAIIDSAVLRLYANDVSYADSAKVNVGPVTATWEQSAVTWNSKPAIDQSQASEATFSITGTGWKQIGVTGVVAKWHDGTQTDKGLFLYPHGFLYGTAETRYAVTFNSKEAADNRPQLVVEYHLPEDPSPTAVPTDSPDTTPAQSGTVSPTTTPELSPTDTPTPETTESPATGAAFLSLTTGQTLIAGLIILALLGAVGAFIAYFSRSQKTGGKSKTEKDKEDQEE
jgi:hypothetical protein